MINFLSPETVRWSESFQREGVGVKQFVPLETQRQRDDNKIKTFLFEGGGRAIGGREENRPIKLFF